MEDGLPGTVEAIGVHGTEPTFLERSSPAPVPGWPCLNVLHADGEAEFLVLSGHGELIGRASSCDLVLHDESVSRRHCRVVEHEGRWLVEDLGSSNGTFVDVERIEPHHPRLLVDGCRVGVGRADLVFYAPLGQHREIVRRAVEDPATGLLNRNVLITRIRPSFHDREQSALAAFDVDGFHDLKGHLGHVGGRELLRRLADALSECARQYEPAALVANEREDTMVVFLKGGNWVDHQAWVESTRVRLSAPEASGGDELAMSAALVPVELRSATLADAERVLDSAVQKLRQAKLAGGRCSATTLVLPVWDRQNERRWRARLHRMHSVAVCFPAHGAKARAASEVRPAIARAIDGLPPRTEVAIAWRPASSLWFVAADCSRDELAAVLQTLEGLKVAAADAGEGAESWLSDTVQNLERRSGRHDQAEVFPAALILEEYRALEEREKFEFATQRFEALLNMLGCMVVCMVAWERAERAAAGESSDDSILRLIKDCGGSPHGAGSWLVLLERLIPHVDPRNMPGATLELLTGPWQGRSHAALKLRNEAVHHARGGAKSELADKIWAQVEQLSRALPSSRCDLVNVLSSEPIQRRPGTVRACLQRLAGARQPATSEEVIPATLTRGLWLHREPHWIPLSPLLVYERGNVDQRRDLYCAKFVPRRMEELELIGVVHGSRVSDSAKIADACANPDLERLMKDLDGLTESAHVTHSGIEAESEEDEWREPTQLVSVDDS